MRVRESVKILFLGVILFLVVGCRGVDDDRIPAMPVSINLSDAGLWNRYGVSGFGVKRYFVPKLGEPVGFFYTATTYTGYGGVLLIGGMDPFTTETNVPLAYDLSCPVECSPNVRVKVDETTFAAVCPECGSKYDVTMQGGAPIAGPASEGKHRYGLRRYTCNPTGSGGYMISR